MQRRKHVERWCFSCSLRVLPFHWDRHVRSPRHTLQASAVADGNRDLADDEGAETGEGGVIAEFEGAVSEVGQGTTADYLHSRVPNSNIAGLRDFFPSTMRDTVRSASPEQLARLRVTQHFVNEHRFPLHHVT